MIEDQGMTEITNTNHDQPIEETQVKTAAPDDQIRAKRLEWMEVQAYEAIKARHATADALSKEAQTTLTVLLAGVAGSAAYAATLLSQLETGKQISPLPLAFAITCAYLMTLAIWLVVAGMRFRPYPAAHQDPSNLLCSDAEALNWNELREEELTLLDQRIKDAAGINSRKSRLLNWIRLLASASPIVLLLSFGAALHVLGASATPEPKPRTHELKCLIEPAVDSASAVASRLRCTTTEQPS